MKKQYGWGLAIGLLGLILGRCAYAQPVVNLLNEAEFLPQYQKALAENPAEATLTVAIDSGKNTFHLREPIPLTFSFVASIPDRYRVDSPFLFLRRMAGNESNILYISPPQDISDPEELIQKVKSLAYCTINDDEFRHGSILSEQPYVKSILLNERVRFERPGKYRLFVLSNRVDRFRDQPQKSWDRYDPVPLVSNILELEIQPRDAEWEHQQYLAAEQTIRDGSDYDAIRRSFTTLRYLETEEAIEPLIQGLIHEKYSQNYSFTCQNGLYCSPFRANTLKRMEAVIDDPAIHLHHIFFETLTTIRFSFLNYDRPSYYPYSDRDEQRVLQYYSRLQWDIYQSLFSEYLQRFYNVRSNRDAATKARSMMTVLDEILSRDENRMEPWHKEIVRQFPEILLAAFSQLTAQEKIGVIKQYSRFLDTPEALPIYRSLFNNPPGEPHSTNFIDLADLALERIYHLNPDEGRKLILEEIQKPLPKASVKILGTLPDKELPGIDKVIVENFADRRSSGYSNQYQGEEKIVTLAHLIERYATPDVLNSVKEIYLGPQTSKQPYWDRIGPLLLAYFLRVDENSAKQYLDEITAKGGFNDLSTLQQITNIHPFPILEQYIIPFLKNEEPWKMDSAAAWLKEYGTIACQQPLWDCMERWNRRWSWRVEDLYPKKPQETFSSDARLGSEVINSLIENPSWALTLDELKRLESLALTDSMKEKVIKAIDDYSKPVRLWIHQESLSTGGQGKIKMGVCDFNNYTTEKTRKKIAQYPKGTVFEYSLSLDVPGANADKFIQELRNYIENLGMTLQEMKRAQQ